MPTVEFAYFTGLRVDLFHNAHLVGGWDQAGRPSDQWSTVAMQRSTASDGCACFTASVELSDDAVGQSFGWGVQTDGPAGSNLWAIATERPDSTGRHCRFRLREGGQRESYHLTLCRALGANKRCAGGTQNTGGRFAVWAPNARAVELVWGDPVTGYIADDGRGRDLAAGSVVLRRRNQDRDWNGVWETAPDEPSLADFSQLVGRPYMYLVTRDDGQAFYKTDLYSRAQLGAGGVRPGPEGYSGSWRDLDGLVACSLVVDPDRVVCEACDLGFRPGPSIAEEEFWRDEFDPAIPIPNRLADMSIYILHVGGLGFSRDGPGTLHDAIAHLDHLVDLGINTVQLMPLSEFEGHASWGYGSSHFFAPDFAGGGRDVLKHFVRAAHRRGIAVMLDVVYNHYSQEASRAEWQFDSAAPERNIYYEYEGRPGDYPHPDGGYIDNGSSGYAPRFSEQMVRKLMISSAAAFATEFHIDGFRLDLTSAIHAEASLHADGRPAHRARAFGQKFLREFNLTLDLVKPLLVVVAEDHSGWPAVTLPTRVGGLGFDARWYVDFYHHLIGDTGKGTDYANLLTTAATSDDVGLALDLFAGALRATTEATIVYHESHDEAGNSKHRVGGLERRSARTIQAAVNRAPLVGETRWWAEARCRYAAAMTFLSAATPMFFMGEEVGFRNDYTFDGFVGQREDFATLRSGVGAALFRFYQDLIRLRERRPVLRDTGIDILHVHRQNRVLAFRRHGRGPDLIAVASLAVRPYGHGYVVPTGAAVASTWREVFNSDSAVYGGRNVGNGGGILLANGGTLNVILPQSGVVVLEAQV